MLGKKNTYVINVSNLKEKDLEMVGKEALQESRLYASGLPVVESMVITSNTFDDFLTAANLIDPIMEELKSIRAYSLESIEKASENIRTLISEHDLPSIVKNPIKYSYENMTSVSNPVISIEASNVIPTELSDTNSITHQNLVTVKGFDNLVNAIKQIWMELFTVDALQKRANENYNGILTIAVLIKKALREEISGKVFTASPVGNNKKEIEIYAVFGIDDLSSVLEASSDVYKIEKESLSIKEKIIVEQDYMLVKQIKSTSVEFIKVDISAGWKKRQKVNDEVLLKLAEYSKLVSEIYEKELELRWCLEGGKITFTSVYEMNEPKSSKKVISELLEEEAFFDKEEKDKKKKEPKEIIKKPVDLKSLEKEIREQIAEEKLDKPVDLVELDRETERVVEKTPKWFSKYNLVTNIYLNVSQMTSGVLSTIQNYNGGFLDGTELLLNNKVIPEEENLSDAAINKMAEGLSIDLVTASQSNREGSLIYQFSNITDLERKLLGKPLKDGSFNGDERFIENPQSLLIEAIAVRKARNLNNSKNISLSIPLLRSAENFNNIKKILSLQSLRKGSSLKIYAEIAAPSIIFELEELVTEGIDGFIVNYDMLLKLSNYRKLSRENDKKVGLKMLAKIIAEARKYQVETIVRLNDFELSKDILALRPNGIIFEKHLKEEQIETLKEFEESNFPKIENKTKRGRRMKELF